MKNNKWSVESFNSKPIYVVLFVSRNKDNKNIEGFTERRLSFITHKTPNELLADFEYFVEQGVTGELSRMYYSVNSRNPQKIYQELLHFLIDNPDFNLCSINPKLAGIAAKKECALEKKWLFDFDSTNKDLLWEFLYDIAKTTKNTDVKLDPAKETPHGYAIVCSHGFDTRELIEKWGNIVTLKRDDLLCYAWQKKESKG